MSKTHQKLPLNMNLRNHVIYIHRTTVQLEYMNLLHQTIYYSVVHCSTVLLTQNDIHMLSHANQ